MSIKMLVLRIVKSDRKIQSAVLTTHIAASNIATDDTTK